MSNADLSCSDCESVPGDPDRDNGIYSCPDCGNVLGVETHQRDATHSRGRENAILEPPYRISANRSGHSLTIRVKPRIVRTVLGLLFGISSPLYIYGIIYLVYQRSEIISNQSKASWIFGLLFNVIVLPFSLFLLLKGIVGWYQEEVLAVEEGNLRIYSSPGYARPFESERTYDVTKLRGTTVSEQQAVVVPFYSGWVVAGGATDATYLVALDRWGRTEDQIPLIFDDPEEAQFLAECLRRHLVDPDHSGE